MKKSFYNAEDIQKITGYERAKAYSLIRESNKLLKEKYKKENKEVMIFPGRVAIWFFEEITAIKK